MRSSIAFVLGLVAGISVTAAYYELIGPEPNAITARAFGGIDTRTAKPSAHFQPSPLR